MFDIDDKTVNVDVRPSTWPMRGVSKSKLQHKVGQKLLELYPHDAVLEEFRIPGSLLTIDFLVVKQKLAIESDSKIHDEYLPFFHGGPMENNFAKQVNHDVRKEQWVENNGFKMVRINSEKDLEKL